MNKKEAIIPFTFIALSLVFVVICAMVFLSSGKSKKWVARKMKIGGLLLSLSTIFSNCHQRQVFTSCYRVVEDIPVDTVEYYTEYPEIDSEIDSLSLGHAEINKQNPQSIVGSFSSLKEYNLSFQVCDSLSNPLQTGRLVDGYNYNSISGDFELILDKMLNPGKYWIKIYACSIENQLQEKPARELNLIVTYE